MDYIEHEMNLGKALNTPGFGKEDRPILDPNVAADKLEMLYRQVADIMLQLSELSLPATGSLVQDDDFNWDVTERPFTMATNELIQLGGLPRSKLPATAFDSASSYFSRLADLHIDHLVHQRNDAVDDSGNCRRKYIARVRFRELAEKQSFTSSTTDRGPFKLWCDDFRPTNILVNSNLQIVGVIDWEFTYTAPAEFTAAPPWWLLLEQPEEWESGIYDWAQKYEERLQTFLEVLRVCEDARDRADRRAEGPRLSSLTEQSWLSGDFWVVYAARKNFAFDCAFWTQLYRRLFESEGIITADTWKEKMDLFDEGEKVRLEMIVRQKMEEKEHRALVWEPQDIDPSS